MRKELAVLEQIDGYISGKMPADKRVAFEQEMANDPGLKAQVRQQQNFIRAVNRNALRSEINSVAGAAGGGGISNFALGVSGVTVVGLVTAGILFFTADNNPQATEQIATNEITVEMPKATTFATDTLLDPVYLQVDTAVMLTQHQPETLFSSTKSYKAVKENDKTKSNVRQRMVNESIIGMVDDLPVEKTNTAEQTANSKEPAENEIADLSALASFPGGNGEFQSFIEDNLTYPETARLKGIEAVIRVDFLIGYDGKISELSPKCTQMTSNEEAGKPFNGMRRLFNKRIENLFIGKATHVIRIMPNWYPAKNSNGNSLVTRQHIYFKFDLIEGTSAYQLEEDIEIIRTDEK